RDREDGPAAELPVRPRERGRAVLEVLRERPEDRPARGLRPLAPPVERKEEPHLLHARLALGRVQVVALVRPEGPEDPRALVGLQALEIVALVMRVEGEDAEPREPVAVHPVDEREE